MIEVPLELRRVDRAPREPRAWFLPGGDASSWVAEVAGWGVPLSSIRLRLVPTSFDDRRPCGALATVEGAERPRPGPRAQPYALVAGRLYLPADAELYPPVSDEELLSILPPRDHVFHPAAGLVAFEGADAFGISRLLETPGVRRADWNRARPGVALGARLLSVGPESVPSLPEFLADGQGDIGARADDLLRGSPDSGRLAASARRGVPGPIADRLQRAAARAALWLARLVPGQAPSPGWIDRMADWARARLARAASAAGKALGNPIDRLLGMLERDLDEALRYALPIGRGDWRGLAPPSAWLSERRVEFDLRSMHAGGPAAPWIVEAGAYQRLIERYHEAANRELRLGRFRRAAYIYAHLLGDFAAAAGALERGRHFREAAVLWRDHVRQPLAAARCLREGGLLLEAIEIYEAHDEHETAGDLYRLLGREEEATSAYRRALAAIVARGETLAAARLLEGKLGSADEALSILVAAWPHSREAKPCLDEAFSILGRLGRHEDSSRLIARLGSGGLPASRAVALAEALTTVAERYPDRGARDRAKDAVRVVSGRHLEEADRVVATSLSRAVARLEPADRLLQRDAARFVADRSRRAPLAGGRPAGRGGAVLLRTFHLEGGVDWQEFASDGDTFFAVGLSDGGIVLLRGRWTGERQTVRWTCPVEPPTRVVLATCGRRSEPVVVTPAARSLKLAVRDVPAASSFPHRVAVGTPPWLPADPLAVAYSEAGDLWSLEYRPQGRYLLCCRASGGAFVQQVPVERFIVPEETTASSGGLPGLADSSLRDPPPARLLVRWMHVVCSTVAGLIVVPQPYGPPQRILDRPVFHLAGVPPQWRGRVAAGLEDGALLWWIGEGWGQPRRLADGMDRPAVAFTASERLVAADRTEIRVYDTHDRRVRHVATIPAPPGMWGSMEVLPADGPNRFALLSSEGQVAVFELPEASVA